MKTSESIKQISEALCAFHKQLGSISKASKNPYFNSKYADLSSILEAIDEPLIDNGLVLIQFPEGTNELTTRILHTSGEWMEATYTMPVAKVNDPQSLGSAISYQRRYSLMSALSLRVVSEDDDANAASGKTTQEPADNKPWLNKGSKEFLGAIKKLEEGTTTLNKIEAVFKLSKEVKTELLTHIKAA